MTVDPLLNSLEGAASGMRAQSLRMRLASENLSNVDTPGYQRKLVSFQEVAGRVTPGRIGLDRREGERRFDPSHPLADANGTVTMSNVDMLIELADAREAGRSYEANLQVFTQARQLYGGLLDILKR